jgi:zinc transport system substrate-binding protein
MLDKMDRKQPIMTLKIVLFLLVAVMYWDSISPSSVSAKGPNLVFVSIVPQKYFVERIGGSHVDVRVMAQPQWH